MNAPPLAAGDFLGIVVFIIIAIVSALSKRNQSDDTPTLPQRRPQPQDLSDEMRKFLEQARKINKPQTPSTPPPIHPTLPPKPLKTQSHQGYQKKIVKPIPPNLPPQRVFEKGEKTLESTPPPTQKIDLLKEFQIDALEKIDYMAEPLQPAAPPTDIHDKAKAVSPSTSPAIKFNAAYFQSQKNMRASILLAEILGKPRAISAYQGPEI